MLKRKKKDITAYSETQTVWTPTVHIKCLFAGMSELRLRDWESTGMAEYVGRLSEVPPSCWAWGTVVLWETKAPDGRHTSVLHHVGEGLTIQGRIFSESDLSELDALLAATEVDEIHPYRWGVKAMREQLQCNDKGRVAWTPRGWSIIAEGIATTEIHPNRAAKPLMFPWAVIPQPN